MAKPMIDWKFMLGNALILASGLGLAVGHVIDPLFRSGFVPFAAFLVFLAGGLSGLLFLALAIGEIAKVSRRLSLLADMNVEINRALLLNEDIDFIYGTILDYLFSIFTHVKYGSVLVLDEEGVLRFASARGFSDEYVRAFALKLEDSFLYQEADGNIVGARLISRKTLDRLVTRFHPADWHYKAVISAPLFADGKLFGLLNLDSERARTFGPEDVRIVERFTAQIEVCLLARGRYRRHIERSRTDALTGLYTRRSFEEFFALELARAERYGAEFILGLFDADGLKKVNDGAGHQAGDAMLKAVADALREGRRKSDLVGRFGGDEFVALYLTGDREAMERGLEETRARLAAEPLDCGGKPVRASFSFGLAAYPEEGKDLESLIAAADRRLYEMKKRRKARKAVDIKAPPGLPF